MMKTKSVLSTLIVILKVTLIGANWRELNGCLQNSKEIECKNYTLNVINSQVFVNCKNGTNLDFTETHENVELTRNLKNCNNLNFQYCDIHTLKNYQRFSGSLNATAIKHLSLSTIYEEELSFNGSFLDGLEALETLDIESFDGKVTLSSETFQNVRRLKRLDLKNLNIQDIPARLFGNLQELEYLSFYGCQLGKLTAENFEGAINLKILDLSGNRFEFLDSDVFRYLENLETLEIKNTQLKSLPDGLFKNNSKLSNFTLRRFNHEFETLPADLLANLPNLKNVVIEIGLKSIPESIFKGSENIEEIDLRGNCFTKLPETLFSDKKKLVKLNLSNNNITCLKG
jgi:Leucine-rich repeat (LRR) protein